MATRRAAQAPPDDGIFSAELSTGWFQDAFHDISLLVEQVLFRLTADLTDEDLTYPDALRADPQGLAQTLENWLKQPEAKEYFNA